MESHENLVIGVDLGQTSIKGAIVSSHGTYFDFQQSTSNLHNQPESVLNSLTSFIQRIIDHSRKNNKSISGIGISSTLDVDSSAGTIRSVSHDYFNPLLGFPIARNLEEKFHLPVIVENDGVSAAWGEYRAGAGQPHQNIVSITLGTGLGGGVILEGKRFLNTLGSAAYFGHMSIDVNGPLCHCGHRGCWELFVSGSALERRIQDAVIKENCSSTLTQSSDGRAVVAAAKNGDRLALELLEEMGMFLGFGLVNITNIFNPEVIVIGGGLSQAGDFILKPACEYFSKRIPIRKNVPIKLAKLGVQSGIVGAALLCFERLSKQN